MFNATIKETNKKFVQNKSEHSEQAKEVLVAKLGSLKDPVKVTQFFQQFEAWKSSNLK